MKWGQIARNALVDSIRVRRREVRPLSPEQAQQFLTAVSATRLEALYSVALSLGVRRGEALGLRSLDIDLDARALRINQSIQRVGGSLRASETKTSRSRRTITLPDFAVEPLKAHHVRQLRERR